MTDQATILIVDDEEDICKALSLALDAEGYGVRTALSGREAIAVTREAPPLVAVVDLLLDDMPGLVVMNSIRETSPDTECIIITGSAPEQSARAAAELGAYGYLMKPCDESQFLLLVRRAVEFARMKQALRERDETIAQLRARAAAE